MSQEELVNQVRAGASEVSTLVAALDDAALDQPSRTEGWTRRDVLAHIAAWYEVAAERLLLTAQGRAAEIQWVGGDVDVWNARFSARDRALTPTEVRQRVAETQGAVMDALESLPESAWSDRTARAPIEQWLPLCTYGHAREHLPDLA